MYKSTRQEKIIEIISNQEVDTQEELCSILNSMGYTSTQATISRDIKQLGLIKISGKEKKYMYACHHRNDDLNDMKILNLFKNCVLSIKVAKNIVVVKTLGGNGNSAGVMVDKLQLAEIVGSVAGDDTVIIVTDSDANAIKVKEALSLLL